MVRALRITAWCVLLLLAVVNGLLALRYLLPQAPFAAPLPNLRLHRVWLAIHASAAAMALILGPFQFINSFRERWKTWHKRLGWIYCGAVLASGIAAIPLSLHANTGPIAGAGFMALAILWLMTTGSGVWLATQRRFGDHRRWMLRSYALTAAAITLRLYLPLSFALALSPGAAYRAIAWLCWLPNLAAGEVYLAARPGMRFRKASSQSFQANANSL